jgi:hypothetical protein
MSKSRKFPNVTTEILTRIKEVGRIEHGVVYDPPDGPRSTASSQTPLGECMIQFDHDSARAELTVTIIKRPWLLPEGILWDGFMRALERCRD